MNSICYLYQKNITLEQAMLGANFKIQVDNGQMIRVKLKPGSFNGQVIRIKAGGNTNKSDLSKDTFIKLRVLDHPFYSIDGLDLKASLLLTPAEAQMGCIKKMSGPDGKIFKVEVKPKSEEGQHVLVKHAGLSDKNETGHIIYQIKIDFLDNIDEDFLLADLSKHKIILN